MKIFKARQTSVLFILIMSVFLITGCGGDAGETGNWLPPDTTTPRVTLAVPANAATGVAINSSVNATFSEAMDESTIITTGTFTLLNEDDATPVSGDVDYSDLTAVFTPDIDLAPLTTYIATITTAAEDLAGNGLATDYVWRFETGEAPDIISPTVTITNPADLDIDVAIDSAVNATFSEAMAPLTISSATFKVNETVSGDEVAWLSVEYDPLFNIATFIPQAYLTPDTDYTATITNGATDLADNPLVDGDVPNPWTFRTAAAIVPEPLAIDLGAAASFGIASRAGLTSTGVTVVNGDVGLDPLATCTDATGGPGGSSQTCLVQPVYATITGMTVNGSIYWAGDPFDSGATALAVTNDLNTAWVEGMSKVNTQPAIAADEIGGKTFIPGVYENANLGLMAGGVATLDAQDDANAIFIFKTTAPGGDFVDSGTLLLPSEVKLINGAQARNVWFVIGRDATIGSATKWNGNILAGRTVTILDGSTVNGRVLAGASGAGAVTLTGAASPSVTTINVPAD
jgi:hypothetical protein